MRYARTHLDELERVDNDGIVWRPVRRALGVTGFGVNGYSAARPGDELIEPHDERSPGAGGHEELYVVVAGAARFTIQGEDVDAPAGTMLLVPVGVPREAVATEPETTVLVVGGKPGAGLPASPFEYWYAAQPFAASGDYARAVAVASEGLADWPEHGALNYQLACYHALAGDTERALEHLRVALAADARTREWARTDSDLAGLELGPLLDQ